MDINSVMEEMVGQSMPEPIVLKKFLQHYKQLLTGDIIPLQDDFIQIAMELNDEPRRFSNLKESCDQKHLDQLDEPLIVKFFPGHCERQRVQLHDAPIGAHKLRSFKALIESKDVNQRNPFRRSIELNKLAPFLKVSKSSQPPEVVCDYHNDMLISINIYRPTRATHVGRTLEKPVFAEQFQCLGSNLLSELRDKISCICNKHKFYDISENPNALLPVKITDPGFFFITDTFYNDYRNSKNSDYSAVILKWAKRIPWFKTKNLKAAKMENTRFIDLTVSLGFPQLYQHHGNCEHLFTFSQVEVLTPSLTYNQNVSRNLYPRLHAFNVYNNRLCNMCGTINYVYIVVNSDRQLHNPAYLCSKCFYKFHYIDEKKIGEFQAYRLQDFGKTDTENTEIEYNSPIIDVDELDGEVNVYGASTQRNENTEISHTESQYEERNYIVIYKDEKQLIVVKGEFS